MAQGRRLPLLSQLRGCHGLLGLWLLRPHLCLCLHTTFFSLRVSAPYPPAVRTTAVGARVPPKSRRISSAKTLFPDKITCLDFQVGVNLGSTTSATAASLQYSVGAHTSTHMLTRAHMHAHQKWTKGSEKAGHSLCHFFWICLNMMPGANSVPTDGLEENRNKF